MKILCRILVGGALYACEKHLAAVHRNKSRVVQVGNQRLRTRAVGKHADLQGSPDAIKLQVAIDRREAGDLLVTEARAVVADCFDGDFHERGIATKSCRNSLHFCQKYFLGNLKVLIFINFQQWHKTCLIAGPLTIFRKKMIKKFAIAAAAALLSLNASAAYVQYNFSGPFSGYIIQNDKDQSIANFRFDLAFDPSNQNLKAPLAPQLSEGSTAITSATTYFPAGGPDNFVIYSDFGGDQRTNLSIDFAGATAANLAFTGKFTYSRFTNQGYQNFAGSLAGAVTIGTVDPLMAQFLDQNGGFYEGMRNAVVPTLITRNDVPEPASLALFAIGAIGAAGMARRRKAA